MQCLVMIVLVITAQGMGTLPTSRFYVDTKNGETGRYYVTLPSTGNKYLCHYSKAKSFHTPNAFSEQCYEKNKDVLTDTENKTKIYPYFYSIVGEPPGCGSLPNVTGARDEWACPRGVSPLSVPVYESCELQCLNGASIKVRCTEKLEFDGLTSHKCSIESSSQVHKTIETSSNFFSIASTAQSGGENRSDKTIETTSSVFSIASTVPLAAENLPVNLPETSSNFPLIAIIVPSAIGLIIVFISFFFLRRHLFTNYKLCRKGISNTTAIDVDQTDKNSSSGSSNEGTDCLIKKYTEPVLSESENAVQIVNDNLTQEDLDSDNSEAHARSYVAFFQNKKSFSNQPDSVTEGSDENIGANTENCATDSTIYSVNYQQEGREEIKAMSPLSPFSISNKMFPPLDIASLKCEDSGDVREDVAFIEWHPEAANYAEPAFFPVEYSGKSSPVSCPTISAMLEGALDNSVHFVDDLSTLLDPDIQYKNPRNWQGLAQSFLGLSYNKIMEIRHKTKDHFKEGILPLLSSYGYTVYDVTYYFSLLPSRRVDVIECIQRYHPNCQKCGEIYNSLKKDALINVS